MVNMVGFHHKEPTYNTATYGQEGWYVKVMPRPTAKHPLRALVSSPCARGVYEDIDHARLWANHPGEAPHLVTAYIEWAESAGGPNE